MSQLHRQQWDNVIPIRMVNFETDPVTNGVCLLVPKFRKGILEKWLQPRIKRKFFKIQLDETGSFAWSMIDDSRNFSEILSAMKGHFGEDFKEPEKRLMMFLESLLKSKFIECKKPL